MWLLLACTGREDALLSSHATFTSVVYGSQWSDTGRGDSWYEFRDERTALFAALAALAALAAFAACYAAISYVTVDVDTRLADPTLTATLRDVNGAERASWTLLRSELE